jgi:hypothetical protein
MRTIIVSSISLLVAAVLALSVGHWGVATGTAESPDPIRVSARGTPVGAPLPPKMERLFQAKGWTGIELISTQASAYYRVHAGEKHCYAVGQIMSTQVIDAVRCFVPPRTIMAFVSAEATRDDPVLRIYSARGIVADGVASVEISTGDGTRAATARVHDNVFELSGLSVKDPGSLVARDENGLIVHEEPLGPPRQD